jgi:asparagine synthase (glutamine-hydrolysing)
MMVGAFGRNAAAKFDRKDAVRLDDGRAVFSLSGLVTDAGNRLWISEDGRSGLAFEGEFYGLGSDLPTARLLFDSYLKQGDSFLDGLNGSFGLALWDGRSGKGLVARDAIGVMPVYSAQNSGGVVFGTDLFVTANAAGLARTLHTPALLKFLTFCYNPGNETFWSGVERIPPGHALEFENGKSNLRRFWELPFEPVVRSETEWAETVLERFDRAVQLRASDSPSGAFLSGGLDSSSVVSLLSRSGHPLKTYSFRCRGESFDESHYARIVSRAFGTEHAEVEYTPESVTEAGAMVRLMDEPFEDVGITIATYLLAKSLNGVDVLFTGDGGDELFGGHPVYAADKAAAQFGLIPGFLRQPILGLGRMLHDSDRKKDWRVKWKRFAESWRYPAGLGTHRWRVYYSPDDLADLAPDAAESDREQIYDDIINIDKENKASDPLSRSLWSDYQTVVQFYLRRMALVRSFGVRPRFPMLDPELVRYCASIPSGLKIRGGEMKYIERVAVEPILPYEITHRKDKLGHSIPLKNWMRDNAQVREFIRDTLLGSGFRNRGLFSPKAVERMWNEHQTRRSNHSHRLWALTILELWLRERWDSV